MTWRTVTYESFPLDYRAGPYRRRRLGWPVHLLFLEHETMMHDDDYLDDARDQARLMSDDEPDSEPGICPACNGSGEGQHEGTTCRTCKGAGEC